MNTEHEIYRLKRQIKDLQEFVYKLEENFEKALELERFHLLRVKNNEQISDDFILKQQTYRDLNPESAYELYNDKDANFIFLDVSMNGFTPFQTIPEAIHIPLEEIESNLNQIKGRGKKVFIISEDGTRSILACKVLNKLGYYNLNNISGGYKYWPGFKVNEHFQQTKSA